MIDSSDSRGRRCHIGRHSVRRKQILAASAVAFAASISLYSAAAEGAPRTWGNTSTTGNWNDSSAWNGNSVPSNGDDAIFTQSDGVDRFVNYVNPGGVSLNLLKIECTGSGVLTLVQNQDLLHASFF